MSTVVWSGPVNLMQVPGATIPGAKMYNVPCLGDRDPRCRAIANKWLSGQQRLPTMLADLGATGPDVDPIYLGAFSAGGIVVKLLCESALDRKRIRAIQLADAIYGGLGDNEGFVAYATEAIRYGEQTLVSTHSAGGDAQTTPSNIRMHEVMDAVEARAGIKFEELPPSAWSGIVKILPVKLWRYGSVWFADYVHTIGHGHTTLSPGLWQNLIVPWDRQAPPLGSTSPPAPPSGSAPHDPGSAPTDPAPASASGTGLKLVAALGGAMVGFAAARVIL